MREISIKAKRQVITLFFSGLSYDQISRESGVSKGGVVNIIDEFRAGCLSVPPGMTEYIDELRRLVVDIKRNDTCVSHLKSYVKLHAKLKEMGVNIEQADQWLDICQDIAIPTVSSNQFVKAALELAQLTSGNGMSYTSALADYAAKLDLCVKLDNDIEQKKEALNQLKSRLKEETQQATEILNSINKLIATNQDAFQKQKKALHAQIEKYIAEHKLSQAKINTVLAVLQSVLGKTGLSQNDVVKISGDIATAGSLATYIGQLDIKKRDIEARISQLTRSGIKTSINEAGNLVITFSDNYMAKNLNRKACINELRNQH